MEKITVSYTHLKKIAKVYEHSSGRLNYKLPLPYYDQINRQFYLGFRDTPEKTVAYLLYSLDVFPSIRIALREINDVPWQATPAIEAHSEFDGRGQEYGEDRKDSGKKPNDLVMPQDNQLLGQGVVEVADQIKTALKEGSQMAAAGEIDPWKVALDPEVEEQIRQSIGGKRLIDSLEKGPEIHKKRLRKRLDKYGGNNLASDEKLVDTDALDPDVYKRQGLKVLNEVAYYTGLITRMIANYPESRSDEQFYKLTTRINSWNASDRFLIQRELKEAMELKKLTFPPVVVLNNPELFRNYQEAGIIVFGLKTAPAERHLVEKGFREIGFVGPEDIGELVAEGNQALSESESKLIGSLLEKYLENLEEEEQSRLVAKLGEYRDFTLLVQQIYRVKKIAKVYEHSSGRLNYCLLYTSRCV